MKKVFLAVLLLILAGCKSEPEPPEGVIPKEKMISLLIDIHILEAKAASLKMNKDSVRAFFPKVEQRLFEKYGISDSVYYKSFEYYLNDIVQMEEIYTAIVDSLSLRERLNEYGMN